MMAFSHAIRDLAVDGLIATQSFYQSNNPRRINYISMEYLIGKMLENNIYALGVENESRSALENIGTNLEEILQLDVEAGLGNGGLGRLASCYLDSLASLDFPLMDTVFVMNMEYLDKNLKMDGKESLMNGCPMDIHGKLYDL